MEILRKSARLIHILIAMALPLVLFLEPSWELAPILAALVAFCLLNAVLLAPRAEPAPAVSRRRVVAGSLLACVMVMGGVLTAVMIWRDYRDYAKATRQKNQEWAGRPAPPLAGRTVDGHAWSLAGQRSKVVVVDFWATWCQPCVRAIPGMKELHEQFGANEDFVMIGVSLDEGVEEVKAFCSDNNIVWAQMMARQEEGAASLEAAWDVTGIPSVWVVDRQGNVVGADLEGQEVHDAVKRALELPDHAP